MKKILKYTLRFFLIVLGLALLFVIVLWVKAASLSGANPTILEYERQLQKELKDTGHRANYLIVSAKRWKWHNDLLVAINGGAAKNSQHLQGNAIDIMVLDVNGDGSSNSQDVDIIYSILDKKIVRNKGGIGTYKRNTNFFDKQMVHFDCRGKRARWHR